MRFILAAAAALTAFAAPAQAVEHIVVNGSGKVVWPGAFADTSFDLELTLALAGDPVTLGFTGIYLIDVDDVVRWTSTWSFESSSNANGWVLFDRGRIKNFEFTSNAIDGGEIHTLNRSRVVQEYEGVNRFTYDRGAWHMTGVTPLSAIPEPASWAMLIVGFGLVGSVARRRRPILS